VKEVLIKLMKKVILLFLLILFANHASYSQKTPENVVYSGDFHFLVSFPDRPTQSQSNFNTKFGIGNAKRWKLELNKSVYEVSAVDFPTLSVEMDYKSLNSFYDGICNDLAIQYGAEFGYYTTVMFGEYGRSAGRITNNKSIDLAMYLVRQRLYLITVITDKSMLNDEQTRLDSSKFLDEFVFIYKKEDEKKLTYGLPQSESQNLQSQE
jgi:hypothetical protein